MIPLIAEHPFAKSVITIAPPIAKPNGQRHFGGQGGNNHFSNKKGGTQRKTQNYGK